MLTLAAAFVFSVYVDPFTDEPTYRAHVGDIDRGPGLIVECSNRRRPAWVVRILPDATVDAEFLQYGPVLARVDKGEPQSFPARYESREVVIEFDDAEAFAQSLPSGGGLIVGVRGVGDRRIDMSLPLDGAREAIEQVRDRCLS